MTEELTTQSTNEVFWGEIAPCEHLLELYTNEESFLGSLASFVEEGIRGNDAVVVIATEAHRTALNRTLGAAGLDVGALVANKQYIQLDATDLLAKFMCAGWPDETRFFGEIKELLNAAGKNGTRRVRAFGEMVAVLWEKGHYAATVRLEHLWNEVCRTASGFTLYCAYPKCGLTDHAHASVQEICAAHSRIIGGAGPAHNALPIRQTSCFA